MTSQTNHQSLSPISPRRPWWAPIANIPAAATILITLILLLRIAWQLYSPLTLTEDEAHYWEWARHLDWSYYSKGPGVAWVIWLSTHLMGNTEYAIRIPAAIFAALTTIAIAKITKDHFQDRLTTFTAAILVACVPGFAVAAMLMTIDSPYIACWAWAAGFALSAILTSRPSAWIGFGTMVAIGFLFKYTILLIIPGVLLAALLQHKSSTPDRSPSPRRYIIIATCIATLGLLPVLLWNANHDWATVRHLLGHLGAPGGDTQSTEAYHSEPWTILWMFEYIALQFLVAGPVLVLAIFAAINARKHATQSTVHIIDAHIAIAIPILVFYFLVSLIAQTEGNWAMAGFTTLVPPAAWAVQDAIRRNDHPVKFAWGAAITIGLAIFMLFPGARWLADRPLIGPLVPIKRISGMREHADDAQRVIDQLAKETNQHPIIMSEHYGRASLLAFYLSGHPTVFCTSSQVGGRKTQYDLWKETDLTNPDTIQSLLGRPGVLFGGRPDQWNCAFDQLTDIGKLINEPKHKNTTYLGYNFHTFDAWTPRTHQPQMQQETPPTP
ncbi:MAG: ArnT family glycosyltransferase [Phycisphaerales bacterium]